MSAAALAAPPRFRGRMPLLRFLRTLKDSSVATYGEEMFEEPIVERRVLWQRYLIVNAPHGIQRVLLDNAANYAKSRVARRLVEPGIGRGLLTSEGETWRRQRRIMAPAFDHRSLMSYAPTMTGATEAMLARWESYAGAPLDIAAEMMRLTLRIIALTMFSTDADDIGPIVEEAVTRYQVEVRPGLIDLLNMPDWWPRPGTRSWFHIFDRLDEVIDRMMRREGSAGNSERRDLLARLLEARDAETGRGMEPREVRDQVVTIFMAGHETTALALTWTWYLLSQHPAVEEKFHAELDRALGGRTPRFEDLAELRYTRMVLEESMRLYPPAHTMSREALADDEVEGHRVRKGSVVSIVPWVLHRHRRLWERPDAFDPERFAPERAAARPRFAYIPFGGGPRICIGSGFATTEALIILAMLGQRYRLRLAPGAVVEPVGLITLRPRRGMPMLLERR